MINGTVKINLPSSKICCFNSSDGPIIEYIVNIASIVIAEINTEIFSDVFV